jgi:hypothetical protein
MGTNQEMDWEKFTAPAITYAIPAEIVDRFINEAINNQTSVVRACVLIFVVFYCV